MKIQFQDYASNSLLITLSPYSNKFILYKFKYNSHKCLIYNNNCPYYFNNMEKINKNILEYIDKNNISRVKIVAVSKSGFYGLKLSHLLSEQNLEVKLYCFNPMLIFDNKILKHDPTYPPSLTRIIKNHNTPIDYSYINGKYSITYTHSTKSPIDSINYKYFKKHADSVFEIPIKSHNCLYPFIKNTFSDQNIDHADGVTLGSYDSEDKKELENFFKNRDLNLVSLLDHF